MIVHNEYTGNDEYNGYLVTEDGTWYDPRTPIDVIKVLEEAMKTKERVRFIFGNTDGYVYLDEYGVMGTVGRSTGRIKVPILIHSSRSNYGNAIMTQSILRIDAKRRGNIVRLYESPSIRLPQLYAKQEGEEWVVRTEITDIEEARFNDRRKVDPVTRIVTTVPYSGEKAAKNYIAFMRGERWAL